MDLSWPVANNVAVDSKRALIPTPLSKSAKERTDNDPKIMESTQGSVRNGLDLRILGVCTGIALDTMDIALLRYRKDAPGAILRVEVLHYSEVPIQRSTTTSLLNLVRNVHTEPSQGTRIDALLGTTLTNGVKTFCQNNDIELNTVDIIGTYVSNTGQDYFSKIVHGNDFTWNTVINDHLQSTVAFNFSIPQSPPSTPDKSPIAVAERLLLQHATNYRAVISIDELLNIHFIPPLLDAPSSHQNASSRLDITRTCGPGTLFTNYAVKSSASTPNNTDTTSDPSARGTVNHLIVDRFLAAYDYFYVRPPLSIAREMFGDHEAQRLVDESVYSNMSDEDTVATMTHITAKNIVKQYRRMCELVLRPDEAVDEIILSGPGARNAGVTGFLKEELSENVAVRMLDDVGIVREANRAVGYAHLAFEGVLEHVCSNDSESVASATSGMQQQDVVRASVIHGQRWKDTLKHIREFSGGKRLGVSSSVVIIGATSSSGEVLERTA